MKKIFSFILCLIFVLACFSSYTYASNGSCGETIIWSFEENNGTLYISGSGEMYDYTKDTDTPWYYLSSKITDIVISEGVTSVGKNSFRRLENLYSVSLPQGLISLKDKAFAYCYSLNEINLPSSLTSIGESCFYYCKSIKNLALPDGVDEIKNDTFFGCQNLVSFRMSDNVKTIGTQAFFFCQKLSSLWLSAQLEKIEENAFAYCEKLSEFRCLMSDDDWEKVTIEEGNEAIKNATRNKNEYIAGDVDSNGIVEINDAIYLLYYTSFGNSMFPIYQNCDFDKNGLINIQDAIYLLYYISFGSATFPI